MKKIIIILAITLIMVQFSTITAVAAGSDDKPSPDSSGKTFEEIAAENQEWFNQQVAANQAWFDQQVAEGQAQHAARVAEMQEQHNKRVAENQAKFEKARTEMQTQSAGKGAENLVWFNQQVADGQANFEEKRAENQANYEASAAAMRTDFEKSRRNNFTIFVIAAVVVGVIRTAVSVSKRKNSAQGRSNAGYSGNSNSGFVQAPLFDNNNMHNDYVTREQNRLFQEQMQRDIDEAARFSMNSSYNAMSDANYAATGIDSFGHNPF